MPLQVKKRCPSCHAQVDGTTNYCPSCGHQLRTTHSLTIKCPQCHRQLDTHSTYCNYCGASLKPTHSSRRFIHFFFSLIVFLLLVLLLFLFFGVPSGVFESAPVSPDLYIPPSSLSSPEVPLVVGSPSSTTPPVVHPLIKTYDYTKSFWIHTTQNFKGAEGFGITTLEFPDTVNQCLVQGTWTVDNDPRARLPGYCDRATGSYSGYADAYRQYVTNDPDYFRWDGKINHDPLPQSYPDYFLYMMTCSTDYYRDNKNIISAYLSGFGTKNLQIEWSYKDNTNKPAVDFFGTLDCELERS